MKLPKFFRGKGQMGSAPTPRRVEVLQLPRRSALVAGFLLFAAVVVSVILMLIFPPPTAWGIWIFPVEIVAFLMGFFFLLPRRARHISS